MGDAMQGGGRMGTGGSLWGQRNIHPNRRRNKMNVGTPSTGGEMRRETIIVET
jgi:hypothetical protein